VACHRFSQPRAHAPKHHHRPEAGHNLRSTTCSAASRVPFRMTRRLSCTVRWLDTAFPKLTFISPYTRPKAGHTLKPPTSSGDTPVAGAARTSEPRLSKTHLHLTALTAQGRPQSNRTAPACPQEDGSSIHRPSSQSATRARLHQTPFLGDLRATGMSCLSTTTYTHPGTPPASRLRPYQSQYHLLP
jgi:hypothetical protein